MIKASLKIDVDKIGDDVVGRIENNIADSEIFESLTNEQKLELNSVLQQSISGALIPISELDLIAR